MKRQYTTKQWMKLTSKEQTIERYQWLLDSIMDVTDSLSDLGNDIDVVTQGIIRSAVDIAYTAVEKAIENNLGEPNVNVKR